MSFTDLAAFRLTITTHLDVGSQIADSKLDDMIKIAENKVTKNLRVREMETALAATINSSGNAAVPTDYLEAKNAYINSTPVRKLERKTVEWIYDNFPTRTAGVERYFAREGSNFIFGEAGSEGRVMKGIYYAKPTAMASTINAVFSSYPEVYLFAALSECEPFIGRDARTQLWEAKYQQVVDNANSQDRDEGFSGSTLATTNA